MGRAEQVKPNFPRDAFAGTADYYVRYRVPYSGRLLRDLVDRAGIGRWPSSGLGLRTWASCPGACLLLPGDLGCRPGA